MLGRILVFIVFSVLVLPNLYAEDLEVTIGLPEVALYKDQVSIDFVVTNIIDNPVTPESMSIEINVDDFGASDAASDDWFLEQSLGSCRYTHSSIKSVITSERGARLECGDLPTIQPGNSLEFTILLTAESLAHYTISGGVGTTSFYDALVITPSLLDSDSDGIIDVEEELAGSDPFESSSTPDSSIIDLLLFYTPEFTEVYPQQSDRDTYFDGFLAYANQALLNSGVRIQLNLVETVASGETSPDGERYSGLISDAANRRNGFEALALIERSLKPDIVGIIDAAPGPVFADGRAQGIASGSPVAYFSTNNSYSVMLHEIGHTLGANHDYPNLDIQFSEDLRRDIGTFNFSYGYVESNSGSVMSYAPNRLAYFSNPLIDDCGLSICGVAGQFPPSAANNALTLNLRRLFIAETRIFDQNFDGIPDWYANKYQLISDSEDCKDPDNDDVPNIGEFIALTDPQDAASKPVDYVINDDCEVPEDESISLSVEKNTPLELDVRQFNSRGGLLRIVPIQQPQNGTLTTDIYGAGRYLYTPEANFEGIDTIVMTIENGIAGTASYVITIHVEGPQPEPVITLTTIIASTTDFDSGDVENMVFGFTISSNSNDVALHNLTVNAEGNINDTSDIKKVMLYRDDNGNGLTEDVERIASDNFLEDDGELVFSFFDPYLLPIGDTRFLVTYQF